MKKLILIICFVFLHTNAFAAGGACPASVPADITECYYVDYVGGSDSNNGTSTSTPWKHAPGMEGVTGVPAAIDNFAGAGCPSECDYGGVGFIFKGGVTWDDDALSWVVRFEGTAVDDRVYFGVDPTWYTGGAWSRPIFNFGGSGTNDLCQTGIVWAPITWVVWDNFEFTGFYWDQTCNGTPDGQLSMLSINDGGNNEIKNNYFHGWGHDGIGADSARAINGTTQGTDGTSFMHDNVFDGSDVDNSSGTSLHFVKGHPLIIYNNYFAYSSNGILPAAGATFDVLIYSNTFYNIKDSYYGSNHENVLEGIGAERNFYFYNNLVKDCTDPGWGVSIESGSGYAAYAFNNVISNSGGNPVFGFARGSGTSPMGSYYALNNTIEAGVDSDPSAQIMNGAAAGPTFYYGNHIIGSSDHAADCAAGGNNCTESNNLFQTKAAAAAEGYTYNSTHPFYANGSTVGAGTDRTSTTPGCGTTGLSSLCSDSSIGVQYNESNNTVSVPFRTVESRGSSWDIGAYEYGAGSTPTNTITGVTIGLLE